MKEGSASGVNRFEASVAFTFVAARRLAHHPEDGFVDRLSGFGFPPPYYPSYRALASTLVSFALTECTSFRWTHLHAGLARRTEITILRQLHCHGRGRSCEEPNRLNLSGDLRTLHRHRSSGRYFGQLYSVGEIAKIIDYNLGPLNDRILPRYFLGAPHHRRTLVRSRYGRFSVLRSSTLSLGWSVVASGVHFGLDRLPSP